MTSVLIIDDDLVVIDTLRGLLAPTGVTTHGATSPAEGERLAYELAVTLVVTDLAFPGAPLGGLTLIPRLRSCPPAPRVLVFSSHDEASFAREALQAGAQGYVCKTAGLEEFATAYRLVQAGKSYLNADLVFALAMPPPPSTNPLDRLTVRQLRMLKLLAEGRSYQRIADALLFSIKTISNEAAALSQQLHAAGKADLIRFAVRHYDAICARLTSD
ncbi:response regulator [Methylobacterium sp. WSM2598]|uniref:response regulator n=1 Tax=Methylobacterium sp. WSM2598 TaxID=398261 RepID=UPI00035D5958|nr:response regulator transcription factor [Methylobacterium sp. WSM2598]